MSNVKRRKRKRQQGGGRKTKRSTPRRSVVKGEKIKGEEDEEKYRNRDWKNEEKLRVERKRGVHERQEVSVLLNRVSGTAMNEIEIFLNRHNKQIEQIIE